MKRTLLLLLLAPCSLLHVHAQKGLNIEAVFNEYATQKNATEVVMRAGRLKQFGLNLFHSIEIKSPSPEEKVRIEKLIKNDARQLAYREETSNHWLYELPASGRTHRYVFYRATDSISLTLIYIEGKADMKRIKSQFLKKKE